VKLSLHMIVRNAEHKLGRTLDSVKSFVDEMVIVDTGSTDGTKALAERYGATVYDYEWADDFSAARNFSLSKTTGDWITWFDAGDVLSPESIAAFEWIRNQQYMTDPNAPINYIIGKLNRTYDEHGLVKVRHATPRLVRRSANPRWISPIHEALLVDNPVIYSADFLVVDDPEGQLSSAAERNLRIMERWMRQSPSELVRCSIMRSRELEALGRYEEAVVHAHMVHQLQMDNMSFGEHYLCLGRCFMKLGNKAAAQEMLLKSIINFPFIPDAFVLLGDLELDAKEWKRAIPYYRASLETDSKHVRWVEVVSYYSYEPYEKLGHCYLGLGDKQTARSFFRQAIDVAPPHVVKLIKQTVKEMSV